MQLRGGTDRQHGDPDEHHHPSAVLHATAKDQQSLKATRLTFTSIYPLHPYPPLHSRENGVYSLRLGEKRKTIANLVVMCSPPVSNLYVIAQQPHPSNHPSPRSQTLTRS